MADLVITASQVVKGSTGADFFDGTAATTILPGQLCYLTAANLVDLADANTSAITATVKGVALHNSLAGQPIKLQTAGDITLGAGAAPVVGTVYVASGTPGGIAPVADKVTGWYASLVGTGKTGNTLSLTIFNSGQLTP